MTLTQAQSPQRHPSAHIPKHTHTHAANLTDSSAALIADLNRPGDLSLSLTHTQHTSFFFLHLFSSPFSSSPSLLFFSPLAQISLALSPRVTLHQLIRRPSPSLLPPPHYLYQKFLGLCRAAQYRGQNTVCFMFSPFSP